MRSGEELKKYIARYSSAVGNDASVSNSAPRRAPISPGDPRAKQLSNKLKCMGGLPVSDNVRLSHTVALCNRPLHLHGGSR